MLFDDMLPEMKQIMTVCETVRQRHGVPPDEIYFAPDLGMHYPAMLTYIADDSTDGEAITLNVLDVLADLGLEYTFTPVVTDWEWKAYIRLNYSTITIKAVESEIE